MVAVDIFVLLLLEGWCWTTGFVCGVGTADVLWVLKEANSGGITNVGVVTVPSDVVDECRLPVKLSCLLCLLGDPGWTPVLLITVPDIDARLLEWVDDPAELEFGAWYCWDCWDCWVCEDCCWWLTGILVGSLNDVEGVATIFKVEFGDRRWELEGIPGLIGPLLVFPYGGTLLLVLDDLNREDDFFCPWGVVSSSIYWRLK